ncbi:MAG: hypothetical protein II620_01385, partial [Paludibacteraceae bacterium]|nr:hypothetical protein [Paludibacteraceae bacterium]
MKKIAFLAIAAVAATTFVACTNTNGNEAEGSDSVAVENIDTVAAEEPAVVVVEEVVEEVSEPVKEAAKEV